MKRDIKLIPIKHETKKKGYRKLLVNVTLWGCDLELTKDDGTKKIINSGQFMGLQELKREALYKANEYKKYLLSKNDFYFI